MALRVIEAGELRVSVYRGRCVNCSCLVECDESDVVILPTGHNEQDRVVNCPTPKCRSKIRVESVQVKRIGPKKLPDAP